MSPLPALLVALLVVGGVALIVQAAPRRRHSRLTLRIGPYLHTASPAPSGPLATGERPLTPFPVLEHLLRPMFQEGAGLLDRWLGGTASVERRLQQAGKTDTVGRFRGEQVLWGLIGFAVAVAVSLSLAAVSTHGMPPLVLLVGAAGGVLCGVLARDWWLTREVQARQARLLAEFPSYADLICLAVTAGESPRAAIERVVGLTHGALSREFNQVLIELRVGTPFVEAMGRLAKRVAVPQITRFVDGLIVAVGRGTPLADVLRAQAADVREQRKRQLIEAGGRKEVYMLVPVVFLILPVVVLFTLYPSYFSLVGIAR
jgi:tight adherence protein C